MLHCVILSVCVHALDPRIHTLFGPCLLALQASVCLFICACVIVGLPSNRMQSPDCYMLLNIMSSLNFYPLK